MGRTFKNNNNAIRCHSNGHNLLIASLQKNQRPQYSSPLIGDLQHRDFDFMYFVVFDPSVTHFERAFYLILNQSFYLPQQCTNMIA